jgi:hypothetical protein
MYRALKLERLLIYSDIYGLGLTDIDVTHLQTVFTAYKQQATMEYIYRAATSGYDLLLNFSQNESQPYLNLDSHERILDQIGYPAIKMDKIFLKFLPQVTDLKFLEVAADFIPQTYEGRESVNLVFNNIDEIKKQIIEQELPHFKPDYYHPLNDGTINMLYACAGKKPPILNIKKKDYDDMPAYVGHIVAVLQLPDDTRVAFFATKRARSSYYSQGYDMNLHYYIVKVGDPAYNWTDEDRYFSHIDSDTDIPRVFYIDANPILPKDKDVIDNYRRGQGVLTVDNTTLDTLVKRWMRKQQDIANEQAAVKALEKKIKDKIEELTTGGQFAYNDVTFRKNEFEYEGQVLSCNAIETKDILSKFAGQYSEDHLNFDRILDVWMGEIYKAATKSPTPLIAHIGDVEVKLEHIARKAKDGIVTHVYRVNDFRVNKDEVQQVIGRAICFPDTATFEEFCDTVSSCSLKYHKYLAGGINVNVHDEIFNQRMEFKISLERQKNKNYIAFNGKTFKVGDTNKLLTILNAKGMSRVIDILLDEKVAGMGGDDIKQLMTTGRQALMDQRQREEELLKSTMHMFGIERVEDFKAQNGKLLSGYLIKGGLRNYVVEEDKLLVYEYPSGRYICMVDKGQNEHTNTARLVNRFFALSNDSRLAKEISTL